MTACPDRIPMLHALVDGELDAVNSLAIEAHLKSCVGCAGELGRIEKLRARLGNPDLRHRAPATLRDRIDAALMAEGGPVRAPASRNPASGRWFAGGALTAIAASLLILLAMPQLTSTALRDQLVADHVRSLLANHLTDVATSNRHVVKPWFNGRIDFAAPVVELAGRGFPLVGGRLDYADGRVVAAIVYRRGLHTINLFVMPARGASPAAGFATRKDGYNLVRWTRNGLDYWAVSDVEASELELFHRIFARETA